jgi:hypothetical protein
MGGVRIIVIRAFIPVLCLALLLCAGLVVVLAGAILHGNMWIDGGILNG